MPSLCLSVILSRAAALDVDYKDEVYVFHLASAEAASWAGSFQLPSVHSLTESPEHKTSSKPALSRTHPHVQMPAGLLGGSWCQPHPHLSHRHTLLYHVV